MKAALHKYPGKSSLNVIVFLSVMPILFVLSVRHICPVCSMCTVCLFLYLNEYVLNAGLISQLGRYV